MHCQELFFLIMSECFDFLIISCQFKGLKVISNKDFRKSIKGTRARFYLCDFHVHSPGSADIRVGERFDSLSEIEKRNIAEIPLSLMDKPVAYEEEAIKKFSIEQYYSLLLNRRNTVEKEEQIHEVEGGSWSFIAITDHNVCKYAALLSQLAWEKRSLNKLIVLPGIELDVQFSLQTDSVTVHLLCIFPPNTSDSDIRIAITAASNKTWNMGCGVVVDSLQEFISKMRHNEDYPAICIAAHIGSGKGLQKESKKALTNIEAAIARTEGEIVNGEEPAEKEQLQIILDNLKEKVDKDISLKLLELIGSCGFDALQVREKKDEIHYRRLHRYKAEYGRSVPIVCSDAHNIETIFNSMGIIPYIKYPSISSTSTEQEIFKTLRDHSLRFGETRFSYKRPGRVIKWVSGIEFCPDSEKAARFWPFNEQRFVLPLSPNLNCLIGGRGSGKSAIIDAISFLLEPKKIKELERDGVDSFSRSVATLSGCTIRLCWQTNESAEFAKGAIFTSRYFDPAGNHKLPSYSDIEGKELISSSLPDLSVQLFRIHEIESITSPEKLRSLFDKICLENVDLIKNKISEVRGELRDNRSSIIQISFQINDCTKEDSPLREYIKRLQQFNLVNKKEIKAQYEKIDEASSAEKLASSLLRISKKIHQNFDFDKRKKEIEELFNFVVKSIDEKESLKSFELLQKMYDEAKSSIESSDKKRILNRIEDLERLILELITKFGQIESEFTSVHREAVGTLIAQGLPPGGKDREAKKSAFDESVEALKCYRELMSSWTALMEKRVQLFAKLKGNCSELTVIRKRTAQRITEQLGRDLDSSVLVIEADAQPSSEKKEFFDWCNAVLSKSIPRFRTDRINALMENGINPETMKSVLLSDISPDVLVVEREKASNGRIILEEARTIFADSKGKTTIIQEFDEEHKEIYEELPDEIKTGLIFFPNSEQDTKKLNLNDVLLLDEIIFDDVPVIKLNDRPSDPGSKMRPLEELSPGQRCSAILPILLINGDSPLVIDQPEDNLDNRLIRQVIVNILASIKLRRQVILATHNPNLPVLGDAEQSIILRAVKERQCTLDGIGDLDESQIVKCITDIMEGGREAFQYRQAIYQSHWKGAADSV